MASNAVLNFVGRAARFALEASICAVLLALTAVVFAQVVARYIFESPLSWSEEMARFLMMWLGMLCAAYAFRLGSHFTLRIVVERLPGGLRRAAALAMHLGVAVFFAVLLWFSIKFVSSVSGHRAPAMQIPMEVPYASIVVGAALMTLEALRQAWRAAVGPVDTPPRAPARPPQNARD
ncbi:MAG: TRAP transporter small permease [Pseudomonadota bacterium]